MLFPGLKNGLLGSNSASKAVVQPNEGRCVTQQEAIDEAVRRFRQQRPFLMELSLNPSHEKVRLQVVDWIRTEYQRIVAEGTVAV
jgi:hypothetical protein